MYDKDLLLEKLSQVAEALARIARRFQHIGSADDFLDSEQGLDMLDSICMMLIAVGENFKSIDLIFKLHNLIVFLFLCNVWSPLHRPQI